jgi:hypothetical protein
MTQRTFPSNQRKIEEAFREFHAAHPEVYAELVRVSRRLRNQGWESFGIATVYEVARYKSMVGDLSGKRPKLNNNYRAYYSRLIMEREGDLSGVFKTRELTIPSHIAP